jgi:hypothetical protein
MQAQELREIAQALIDYHLEFRDEDDEADNNAQPAPKPIYG